MTLEELSVSFTADISPFEGAMNQLGGLLSGMGSAADSLAGHFYAAGAQAGDGLKNGLLSRKSAVMAAAQALAQAAEQALRNALDIHSPSRRTYEAGRFFDEGLLLGIRGSATRVAAEAAHLGTGVSQYYEDAAAGLSFPASFSWEESGRGRETQQNLPPLSLTIPLEIDGYRLGVAAIDGINQVAQGAGRVKLML